VAFNTLKTTITSIFVLVFLNTITFFYIKADSSDYATEAFLSQELKVVGK